MADAARGELEDRLAVAAKFELDIFKQDVERSGMVVRRKQAAAQLVGQRLPVKGGSFLGRGFVRLQLDDQLDGAGAKPPDLALEEFGEVIGG